MAEDFLSGLFGGGGGGLASQGLSLLASYLSGGMKSRPSNRDLEFMNDEANKFNPDEIQRQGDFLKGLAPSQAEAYNTFQNSTYQQQVDRQAAGIKSESASLGMSPWEFMGTGGSAPLPAMPSTEQGDKPTSGFLQGIIPLQTAKMANQTALMTTAMNNKTAKDINAQNTAGGQLPQQQLQNALSQQKLTDAQTALAGSQNSAARNKQVLDTVGAIASLAPKVHTEMDIPGFGQVSSDSVQDFKTIAAIIGDFTNAGVGRIGNVKDLASRISSLKPDQYDEVRKAISRLASAAAKGGNTIMDALGDAQQFLKGMTDGK